MDDFLNTENFNKQWIIMNIYNQDYNVDGLFPNWVKSAMDSLTSGNYNHIKYLSISSFMLIMFKEKQNYYFVFVLI